MFGFFPINYIEPVYRPPAEAQSLLLQVTLGCSHNACTFCAMYRSKRYSVRPFEEIARDIDKAVSFFERKEVLPRKVFLCDGDALSAPTQLLLSVLDYLRQKFPSFPRVGIYASARNVLDKSESELKLLSERGLKIAYLGVESGSNSVLQLISKGVSASETEESCLRLKAAGWKISEIVMLGVGGRALSQQHCAESAALVSKTVPNFFSFLTTVAVPKTPYARQIEKGQIQPLSTRELLIEMRSMIEAIMPQEGRIIFRANHVSNQFPLEGILPRDRESLVQQLTQWIAACPEGVYPDNDPAFL